MTKNEKVTGIIFDAVDELNQILLPEQQLEKSVNTVLFGDAAKLDSLGLVNFIVLTEQKIEEGFSGATIILADVMDMPPEESPLATVGSLIDYISLQL